MVIQVSVLSPKFGAEAADLLFWERGSSTSTQWDRVYPGIVKKVNRVFWPSVVNGDRAGVDNCRNCRRGCCIDEGLRGGSRNMC